MKEFIKKNSCKFVLSVIQITFLGGGYAYVEEFKALRDQIKQSETEITTQVSKLQKIGKDIDGSIRTTSDGLKKVEKACKKFF